MEITRQVRDTDHQVDSILQEIIEVYHQSKSSTKVSNADAIMKEQIGKLYEK